MTAIASIGIHGIIVVIVLIVLFIILIILRRGISVGISSWSRLTEVYIHIMVFMCLFNYLDTG